MPPPVVVAGAILAAGWSRRMGRPKALLPCRPGSVTFVERLARTLGEGGVNQVLVVGRPNDAPLRAVVDSLGPAARFVENPAAERGQLSSILVAVDEAERTGATALLVVPVDMPMVRSGTIAAALDVFKSGRAPIVRVTHGGQHGHPVIFDAAVFGDLRAADPSLGAKAVVRLHQSLVDDVEVDDPGVLRDVDVAADYRAMFGRDPE